jgi:hypothetical protein
MKQPLRRALVAAVTGLSAIATGPVAAQQNPPAPADRVAALKQSLQASQVSLRKYEWIETTIISLKGEEKSRKQQRCYYGADGKLVKVPVEAASPPAADQGRSRRGGRLKERIVENKKDEMQEYMERAVSLVHQYVPPDPAAIDTAKKAGKIALRPGQSGRARVEFTDFIKPGDMLGVDVDPAANQLAGLTVASYLDEPGDSVTLNVQFGVLADGTTSYPSQTSLEAKAKNIRVVIQNSGYKPIAR